MIKNKIVYLLLLGGALVFFSVNNGYHAFIVLLLLLLYPVLAGLYLVYAYSRFEVQTKQINKTLKKGKPVEVNIMVVNRGVFPIVNAKILVQYTNGFENQPKERVYYLTLGGRKTESFVFKLDYPYCGSITLTANSADIYDPLMLFCSKKKMQMQSHIIIWPDLHAVEAMIIEDEGQNFFDAKTAAIRSGNDPSEIFDLREYQAGDSMRKIHWKISLRLDTVIVKELGCPINDAYLLLVELCFSKQTKDRLRKIDALLEAMFSISYFLVCNEIIHYIGWVKDSPKKLIRKKIDSVDTLYEVIKEVFTMRLQEENPYGIRSFEEVETSKQYDHLMYFTSEFNKKAGLLFGNYQNAARSSLFYVDGGTETKSTIAKMGFFTRQIMVDNIKKSLIGIKL